MSDFLGTPAAEGLYMPPDWSTHERCWMAWPQAGIPWLDALEVARMSFAEVARQISRYEPVTVVAPPWDAEEASMMCGPSVEIAVTPVNTCWARDFGPSFLTDGEGGVAAIAWRYNGYGNRLAHDLDQYFAEAVAETLEMKCYEAPMVMEGGAFHVDEVGTLVTTDKVVCSKNRNPTLSLAQIEERFVYYLGARKIIWVPEGLTSDKTTDGHIDNVMCFAPGGKVLLHTPSNQFDPDSTVTEEVRRILTRETNASGKPFEIIDLPAPQAGFDYEGEPAPRSYTNFYVANHAVIVPAFDCPEDEEAQMILDEAFPDHEVVPVEAGIIAFGRGGIHSITLQQPKGKALPRG